MTGNRETSSFVCFHFFCFPLVLFTCSSMCPLVVAAHPQEPNQFAVGLSDGSVVVCEPLESDGSWGSSPPAENGSSTIQAGGIDLSSR